MNDPLKAIFNQHKKELFSEELSAHHLSKFEKRLEEEFEAKKKFKKQWIYYSGIAASIAFFITIGILFFESKPHTNTTIAQTEIQESEDFFALAVAHKINKLKTYETPQTKPYIQQCLNALNQLDQDYIELKNDFKHTENEMLIGLMLDNLKKRTDIIEKLIKQLEHHKNQEYEL